LTYCRWSKACASPGPFLALIDGQWFECLEPEKELERELFCPVHAGEFQKLGIRNVITEDGESTRNARASPYLLFTRRMIDLAIQQGQETTAEGEPTDDALLTRQWVEYQPDWKDREDFYGSFEWCCHWLSAEVKQERERVLGLIDGGLFQAFLTVKREQFRRRQEELVKRAMEQERQGNLLFMMAAAQ